MQSKKDAVDGILLRYYNLLSPCTTTHPLTLQHGQSFWELLIIFE